MIYVVGIGPGEKSGRSFAAQAALEACEVIAGYSAYIALIEADFPDKPLIQTGMRGEVERCRLAIEHARAGFCVAMVCSGDASVYGMASLLLELADDDDEIVVVPGVTAALSASALMGAPISGDFCCISLSDLLTPWAVIEKRLRAAAQGDFPIALYNPSSHKRADYLAKACDILLETLPKETPCGIAQNIGRENQRHRIVNLCALRDIDVDMFTTVIIGNSMTLIKHGRLVTPRGYRK